MATLKYILKEKIIDSIESKEKLFRTHLKHKKIKSISGKGLMLSIDLYDNKHTNKIVEDCMKDGLLLFYFLFNDCSIRLTPPLTISNKEIVKGCKIIINNLNKI